MKVVIMHPFEKIRADQRTLAGQLACSLYERVCPRVADEIHALNELFSWQDLTDPSADCDMDAFKVLLEHEMQSDMLDAVQGYTDWVATQLVRSEKFEPLPLPRPEREDLRRIAEAYGVTEAFLKATIGMLLEQSSLPLLGRIEKGRLVPDRVALEEWKSYFDWSDQ